MADRSCPVCGEHTTEDARFCAACGVRLDAPVVLDGENPSPATSTEHVRSGGRFASVLVPLLVLGVLAAGAFVLFGGGEDADPDAASEDALADQQATPTADVEPTSTPAAPAATTRPTPRPTPTPPGPEARVDVAALPPIEATHLAVSRGNDVGFLDLDSGEWVIHESVSASGPPDMAPRAFERGIVLNDADGAVRYVPVDGAPRTLRQGWMVGATPDRVWIHENGNAATQRTVAIDGNGEVVDEYTAPPMAWIESVLPTGELVIRAGGKLFVRSETGTRPVVEGEVYGRVDTRALTQQCDDDLSCSLSIVNLLTGEASTLELELEAGDYPQLAPDGLLLYGRNGPSLYGIDGSTVVFVRDLSHDEAEALLWAATTSETEPEGVTATIEDSTLWFRDASGVVLTHGSIEVFGGYRSFGGTSLLFITVADAA